MKRKTLRERAMAAARKGPYMLAGNVEMYICGWLASYRACQADARRKARNGKGEK